MTKTVRESNYFVVLRNNLRKAGKKAAEELAEQGHGTASIANLLQQKFHGEGKGTKWAKHRAGQEVWRFKHKNGLIPKKVQVKGKTKTFQATRWTRAGKPAIQRDLGQLKIDWLANRIGLVDTIKKLRELLGFNLEQAKAEVVKWNKEVDEAIGKVAGRAEAKAAMRGRKEAKAAKKLVFDKKKKEKQELEAIIKEFTMKVARATITMDPTSYPEINKFVKAYYAFKMGKRRRQPVENPRLKVLLDFDKRKQLKIAIRELAEKHQGILPIGEMPLVPEDIKEIVGEQFPKNQFGGVGSFEMGAWLNRNKAFLKDHDLWNAGGLNYVLTLKYPGWTGDKYRRAIEHSDFGKTKMEAARREKLEQEHIREEEARKRREQEEEIEAKNEIEGFKMRGKANIMPEDTFKSIIAALPRTDFTDTLQNGTVTKIENFTGGVNATLRVDIKDDGQGVLKPIFGETTFRENIAFDPSQQAKLPLPKPECNKAGQKMLYRREAASWIIAKVLGLDDLHPETCIRNDPELGICSIQQFIPDAKRASDFALEDKFGSSKEDIVRAAFFDLMVEHMDRHDLNWMIKDGKIVLIDNGYAFANKGHSHWNASWITDEATGSIIPERLIKKAIATKAKAVAYLHALFPDTETGDQYGERVDLMEKMWKATGVFTVGNFIDKWGGEGF